MRGSIALANYKHHILPFIFLRYLSNRFKQRKLAIENMTKDPNVIGMVWVEKTTKLLVEIETYTLLKMFILFQKNPVDLIL
ncbi:type I restriction-modification system subunit M N-terminal domain-containing protein [Peribacillus loiseleuriae]|uniref:type I restriction-modification system subunit M N-terminal domain-containing protein n=1 Tax=Peribacillus loiseleuriae TaxID=1679170 RepID=UPI0038226D13